MPCPFCGGYGYGGGFGMLFNIIFGILILAGIILIIWWLIQQTSSKPQGITRIEPTKDKALSVLNERYAKGEITKEQYEQMKKDLMSS